MKLAIQENLIPGKSFLEKMYMAEDYGFQAIEVWGTNLTNRVDEITKSISKSRIKISTICAGYRGSLLSAEKRERISSIIFI